MHVHRVHQNLQLSLIIRRARLEGGGKKVQGETGARDGSRISDSCLFILCWFSLRCTTSLLRASYIYVCHIPQYYHLQSVYRLCEFNCTVFLKILHCLFENTTVSSATCKINYCRYVYLYIYLSFNCHASINESEIGRHPSSFKRKETGALREKPRESERSREFLPAANNLALFFGRATDAWKSRTCMFSKWEWRNATRLCHRILSLSPLLSVPVCR